MQLSKFTDYTLRVLIYLATKPEARFTIDEISSRYGISKEHLRKIVHQLSKGGWIDSRRGRDGGIRLACPAANISIGQIVREAEGNLAIVECFQEGNQSCQIFGVCRLQGMLHEALLAFLAILDKYSLADIVDGQVDLLSRLGLAPEEGTTIRPFTKNSTEDISK